MHFSDLNSEYLELGFGRGGPLSAASRAKRMRTSFKHHQLRTMKSYFAINHNPDAKDLKQLSQKTGLPKRVLQVSKIFNNKLIIIKIWFLNDNDNKNKKCSLWSVNVIVFFLFFLSKMTRSSILFSNVLQIQTICV